MSAELFSVPTQAHRQSVYVRSDEPKGESSDLKRLKID